MNDNQDEEVPAPVLQSFSEEELGEDMQISGPEEAQSSMEVIEDVSKEEVGLIAP